MKGIKEGQKEKKDIDPGLSKQVEELTIQNVELYQKI
jgi:hypothetical protein